MLEFDIETAKLALAVGSGRIVTRSGHEVEITNWDNNAKYYSVEGIVMDLYTSTLTTWTKKGIHRIDGISNFDLFIEELC